MEGYIESVKSNKEENLSLQLFSFAAQAALLAFASPMDLTGKMFESMIQVSVQDK